jgi:hypothetical protein
MTGTKILRMTPTLRGIRSKSEDFCAGQNLWEGQTVALVVSAYTDRGEAAAERIAADVPPASEVSVLAEAFRRRWL